MGITQFDIAGYHEYRRIKLPTGKVVTVDLPRTAPRIATKETVARIKKHVKGNGNGNGEVLDVMQTLGVKGLWNVYTTGGAYGSKEATKKVFEEYWEAKDYDKSHLENVWDKEEWKTWQPESTIPIIPSIQIPKIELPDFGAMLEDLKVPLLIAGGAIAGLFILGKFIGRK